MADHPSIHGFAWNLEGGNPLFYVAGNVGSFDRSQAFGRSMVTTTSAAQGQEFQMFVAWCSFGKDHQQIKGWDWKAPKGGRKVGHLQIACFWIYNDIYIYTHTISLSFLFSFFWELVCMNWIRHAENDEFHMRYILYIYDYG